MSRQNDEGMGRTKATDTTANKAQKQLNSYYNIVDKYIKTTAIWLLLLVMSLSFSYLVD